MDESSLTRLLPKVCQESLSYYEHLDNTPVAARGQYQDLMNAIDKSFPEEGVAAEEVIDDLIADMRDGLHASTGGRFYGWVIGGNLPASLAADWLTSVWDQNAALFSFSPASAVVEEVAGKWLKDVLHLPTDASFAIVSGCQMAHVTAIAAARHELLSRRGIDIEVEGLYDVPRIRIICSERIHATVDRAVRLLGLGSKSIIKVACDRECRVKRESLESVLINNSNSSPTIVILQAGDVNTGAFDDFEGLIPLAHQYDAWVHIDGAFGLWARASPKYFNLTKGVELADSWATDGHKWLNVPYDSGFVLTRHPTAQSAAVSHHAAYLSHHPNARDQIDWNPEFSRRARGNAVYAALRSLGRKGVARMIEQCCDHTKKMINALREIPNVEICSEPIINQALVRFHSSLAGAGLTEDDRFTEEVIAKINASGEAFFSFGTWDGRRVMRVSVSNWRSSDEGIERVVNVVRSIMSSYPMA